MTDQTAKQLYALLDLKTIIGAICIALVTWFGTVTFEHSKIISERLEVVNSVHILENEVKQILVNDIPNINVILTRIEAKQDQQYKNIKAITQALNEMSENQVYISKLNISSKYIENDNETSKNVNINDSDGIIPQK